jgi:hypothetical protein
VSRIRVFLSFDGDHDGDLHDRLQTLATRPGSSFECSARSDGHSLNEAWNAASRTRIRAADEVVVICGEHTNASPRVAAELRIAQEEGKPYLLLWGRRECMCTKPEGAKPGDAMYSWAGDMLDTQISATLRNSRPREVAEALKRPPAR